MSEIPHPLSSSSSRGTASAAQAEDSRPAARALYRCGLGRLKLGDVRGAYEDFKEAARIEPRDWEIWQKYEETYRTVASEVEEELALFPGTTRQTTAPGRPTPPQHFTLRRPSEAQLDLEHLQAAARGSTSSREGSQELSGEVQARLLRPVQQRSRNGNPAAEGEHGPEPTPSASSFGGHGQRNEPKIELTNRTYVLAINISWGISILTVLYHYGVSKRPLVVGTFLILWLAWLTWWFRRRRKIIIGLSVNDGVKIVALVIIAILTVWHYSATKKNISLSSTTSTSTITTTTSAPESTPLEASWL